MAILGHSEPSWPGLEPGLARTGPESKPKAYVSEPLLARSGASLGAKMGHFGPFLTHFGQVLTGPGQARSPSSENSVRF